MLMNDLQGYASYRETKPNNNSEMPKKWYTEGISKQEADSNVNGRVATSCGLWNLHCLLMVDRYVCLNILTSAALNMTHGN